MFAEVADTWWEEGENIKTGGKDLRLQITSLNAGLIYCATVCGQNS